MGITIPRPPPMGGEVTIEPDISSFRRQSGLCHLTATAAVRCDGPLPGLSGGTVGASSDKTHLARAGQLPAG